MEQNRMCGIVGYVGPREASEVVVGGLQRLEYRGYDSAGIAIYDAAEGLQLRRSVGKLGNLVRLLAHEPAAGQVGMGHTRWATHGDVTEANAHPHRDASGRIVVIQNGIVENYLELKARLIEQGAQFQSQTDTEVLAQLLGRHYQEEGALEPALRRVERIYAVACGTAWHAGLLAKFMIESLARVRVEVDYASEFRYRGPVLGDDALLLAITQSGETVDTLAAMELARSQGVPSVAIVNAIGSQAARLADGGPIYLHAGPEIGVASTKAFTSMLAAAYLFALRLAQARGTLTPAEIRAHLQGLVELPGKAAAVIERALPQCEALAERYHRAKGALFLGRQASYPVALEGALKLKEISYIHAEGYPAGEMKHGPIALIDEDLPVVCIAPRDAIYEKMISNIEQVRARRGQVIAVGSEGDALLAAKADHVIAVPETLPLLQPILSVIPLQIFAYAVALRRGCDVDQPRNLAKSVTVE
jgi:glutamine---fructose-6-phosphate transaminase (isomerizing)